MSPGRTLRLDRGQAHTLEAVTAALILLGSIVFALQSTAVTPLSASTASQHIENQQAATGEGMLAAAAANDSLRGTLLYTDDEGCFHGTERCGSYISEGPPTTFGESLNETFVERGIAVNVNVLYLERNSTDIEKHQIVDFGDPSDHAVTVRQTVTLYDDDVIRDEDGEKTDVELQDLDDDWYAPNVDENSSVYNVVQVEVEIWRM